MIPFNKWMSIMRVPSLFEDEYWFSHGYTMASIHNGKVRRRYHEDAINTMMHARARATVKNSRGKTLRRYDYD